MERSAAGIHQLYNSPELTKTDGTPTSRSLWVNRWASCGRYTHVPPATGKATQSDGLRGA
jgi:hypothetical protein